MGLWMIVKLNDTEILIYTIPHRLGQYLHHYKTSSFIVGSISPVHNCSINHNLE